MQGQDDTATDIFQSWLDEAGAAIFGDDFDRFARITHLPCILASEEMRTEIHTLAQLRDGFDAFAQALRGHGATAFVRRAQHVERLTPQMIVGLYETDIIARSAKVVPSYTSAMVLQPFDGVWKCVEVTSGLANQTFPWSVLRPKPEA